mgnify:CR=1 FL=1
MSMNGLGYMYLYGKGVEVDEQKAFELFKGSADQDDPEGQLRVGMCYFSNFFSISSIPFKFEFKMKSKMVKGLQKVIRWLSNIFKRHQIKVGKQ